MPKKKKAKLGRPVGSKNKTKKKALKTKTRSKRGAYVRKKKASNSSEITLI